MLFHWHPAEGLLQKSHLPWNPGLNLQVLNTSPRGLHLKGEMPELPSQPFPGLNAEQVPGLGESEEKQNFSLSGLGGALVKPRPESAQHGLQPRPRDSSRAFPRHRSCITDAPVGTPVVQPGWGLGA